MIIAYIIIALIGLVLAVGACYEILFSNIDRARYRIPPGKLIDIGEHHLHIKVIGEHKPGEPTVVMESGVASNSLDWQRVQPQIAEFAQVVVYDRGGYGWSDRGPEPRTPLKIVEELHRLLHTGGIEPPYLLIGHSLGGLYIRLFADAYSEEVAGLILVDSSHPDMIRPVNTEPEMKRLRRVAILKRFGLVRAMLPRILSHSRFIDGAARKKYLAMNLLDSDNVVREARPLYEGSIELSDKLEIPLTVISRERFPELASEVQWQGYQDQLAALSANSKHIHAKTSSHYIALAEPDTVVRAIREMIEDFS